MENSKLMTPLFYNGSFNREGHRMRAVFEREITNGTETYRLWRSAGRPDLEFPRAENDAYILHAEINGYLVPLGMTEYALIDQCGFKAAEGKLYGGTEERGRHFTALRESGGDAAVLAALETERAEIERQGSDPAVQTDYIRNMLAERVKTYLEAKANGGQTFPDFYGAAVLNELAECVELSAVYRAKRQVEQDARRARAAEEERVYCEEQNRLAEQTVSAAIQIIRCGGVLKNDTVKLYRSRYDSSSYSIVNYLMRQYHVDVPLRTQGWINEKLVNATIENGRCIRLQYLRSKGAHGSQKFFECMNALVQAVSAQASECDQEAA